MEVVITQEHLDAAKKAGACWSVRKYKPGTPITEVLGEHLELFAEKFPDLAKSAAKQVTSACAVAVRGTVPLAVLGDGDGYGSGDGYGYGDGDGDIVQAA
jgi:hypothetical protein